MVYALIGIPLALFTLNSFGGLISHGVSWLISTFEKRVLKTPEPRNLEIKVSVLTILLTLMLLLAGSAIPVVTHGWSFLEAFYFWFVTFTTIGFGDYVMNSHEQDGRGVQPMFDLFSLALMLFGLAVVASGINSLLDVASKRPCRLVICSGSLPVQDSNAVAKEDSDAALQIQMKTEGREKSSVSTMNEM